MAEIELLRGSADEPTTTITGQRPNVWGGNRTDHGAWTWTRLVTFITTVRQQGLDILSVFTNLAQQPTPSLAIPLLAAPLPRKHATPPAPFSNSTITEEGLSKYADGR